MGDLRYPIRLENGTIATGELSDQEKALSSLLTIKGERPLSLDYGSEPYIFNTMVQLGVPFTVTGLGKQEALDLGLTVTTETIQIPR